MQGISSTSPPPNQIIYSNEKIPGQDTQRNTTARDDISPITELHEQIIEHVNLRYEKYTGEVLKSSNVNNTLNTVNDARSHVNSSDVTVGDERVKIASEKIYGEMYIEKPQAHTIKKRSVLSITNEAGQKKIIHFLKQNGLMNEYSSNQLIEKEILIAELARYLYKKESGDESQVKKDRKVARVILANANLYGGVKGERISPEMAKTVIKEWLFHQVLSSSIEQYIAGEIRSSEYPSYFTVSSLNVILDAPSLISDGKINITHLDEEQKAYFNVMWRKNLKHEIPFIKTQDDSIRTIPLMSQDFADLYTGCKFLNSMNKLANSSLDEITAVGRSLWNIAFNEGIAIDNIGYFILPSVIMENQTANQPNPGDDAFSFKISTVDKYIRYQRDIIYAQQDFIVKTKEFNRAISLWLAKGSLADNIIADCPTPELISYHPYIDIAPAEKIRKIKEEYAKEDYLNSRRKPCLSAPEKLSEEYEKQTKTVSQKFKEMNRSHINLIFLSENKSELNFISSVGAKLNFVDFSMRSNLPLHAPMGGYYDPNFNVKIKNAELFSVTVGDQERIYALKREISDSKSIYKLLRVDRDIQRYIDNDLLGYDFSSGYKIEGNKVISRDVLTFGFSPQKEDIENSEQGYKYLVNFLNDRHTDEFYTHLFETGNDKSKSQASWDIIKHFIPFYDCVESIKEHNVKDSIFSCVLDAFSVAPLGGAALSLGGKFGMGLARGIRLAGKQLIRGAFSEARTTLLRNVNLPIMSEYGQLGRLSLRVVDPGFELLAKSRKIIPDKLISYLKQEKKATDLASKLESLSVLQKKSSTTVKNTLLARFPDSNIEVEVKKIGRDDNNDVYVMTHPENNDGFGGRYLLSEDKIINPYVKQPSYQAINTTNPGYTEMRHMDQRRGNIPLINISRFINDTPPHLLPLPLMDSFLPINHYVSPYIRSNGAAGIHIEQPHLMNDYSDTANAIKSYIIENYNQSDVYLCRFNQSVDDIPPAFQQMKDNLHRYKQGVLEAQDAARKLSHEFFRTTMVNNFGILDYSKRNRIRKYLFDVLDLRNVEPPALRENILREAMQRLKYHADNVNLYLKWEINNIYFASCHTQKHPYHYTPSCPVGFMNARDDLRRIIIMVDNYHSAPQPTTTTRLSTLHETTHFSGSLDFFQAPSLDTIGDASEFMDDFKDGLNNYANANSITVPDQFIEAYRQRHPGSVIDNNQFREMLKSDPMLRANAFMENADFLARMISDLGRCEAVDSDAGPCVRKPRETTTAKIDMSFVLYKNAIEIMRIREIVGDAKAENQTAEATFKVGTTPEADTLSA